MKNLKEYINESIVEESISGKFERIKTQLFKKLGSKYVTDAGTIIVTKWWSNSDGHAMPDNNLDFEKKYNDIVGRIVEVLKKITGIKNPKEDYFHAFSAGAYIFNTGISDKDELDKLWDEIKTKVNNVCGNEVNSIKETETVFRASKARDDIKELNIEMMPELYSYTYAAVELYVEDSLY